jgi:hypothetical protein
VKRHWREHVSTPCVHCVLRSMMHDHLARVPAWHAQLRMPLSQHELPVQLRMPLSQLPNSEPHHTSHAASVVWVEREI